MLEQAAVTPRTGATHPCYLDPALWHTLDTFSLIQWHIPDGSPFICSPNRGWMCMQSNGAVGVCVTADHAGVVAAVGAVQEVQAGAAGEQLLPHGSIHSAQVCRL